MSNTVDELRQDVRQLKETLENLSRDFHVKYPHVRLDISTRSIFEVDQGVVLTVFSVEASLEE